MTEVAWLAGTDPRPLLKFLGNQIGPRKLRLFGVECCKQFMRVLDHRGTSALETAERYAEGLCGADELEAARTAAMVAFNEFDDSHPWGPGDETGWESAADAVEWLCRKELHREFIVGIAMGSAHVWGWLHAPGMKRAMRRFAFAEQSRLLRDIVGNPFRPGVFDPRWRTADVTELARTIYEDRAFDRMQILADALMDAGCADEQVLGHCRSAGPHVRGCWVVDLALGKE